MNEQMNLQSNEEKDQADEIDFATIILTLWNCRKWIVIGTAVITLFGILYAFCASPVYDSQATIALREQNQSSGVSQALAQFGGAVGGLVTSNNSLDKIEIILKGHELAEAVIVKNNLLPVLFPHAWDSTNNSWKAKNPEKAPTLREGVEVLRGSVLNVSVDPKEGILTLGARTYNSALAKNIVDFYLIELNNRIRADAMNAANADRKYLENQLDSTSDPALIEKIRDLISIQIEKSMLVSSQAFQVLEAPVVPITRSSPQRKKIVMLSFLMGILFSVGGIFAWKGFVAIKTTVAQGEGLFDKRVRV